MTLVLEFFKGLLLYCKIYENLLSCKERSKIGILGINGSGKTSLLRIIAGEDDDYDGEIKFNSNVRVGYLPQEPDLDEDLTVEENILEGIEEKLEILDVNAEVITSFLKFSKKDVMVDFLF